MAIAEQGHHDNSMNSQGRVPILKMQKLFSRCT